VCIQSRRVFLLGRSFALGASLLIANVKFIQICGHSEIVLHQPFVEAQNDPLLTKSSRIDDPTSLLNTSLSKISLLLDCRRDNAFRKLRRWTLVRLAHTTGFCAFPVRIETSPLPMPTTRSPSLLRRSAISQCRSRPQKPTATEKQFMKTATSTNQ